MHSFRRAVLANVLKFLDIGVMAICMVLAFLVLSSHEQAVSFEGLIEKPMKAGDFIMFLFYALSWYLVFSFFGLYHFDRLEPNAEKLKDITAAVLTASILLYVGGIVFNVEIISIPFVISFAAIATSTAIVIRLVIAEMLKQVRLRGRNLRHVVIVGSNNRAMNLAENIRDKPEMGYQILGFVDDEWQGKKVLSEKGFNSLGTTNMFDHLLDKNIIDEVFLALPVKTYYSVMHAIVQSCEERGILVHLVGDVFDLQIARSKIDMFEERSIVTVYTGAMTGPSVILKRAIDILCSALALFCLSPVFLATAILIKATSPGPVFFFQNRAGLNMRPFRMLKFRTMVNDAERMIDQVAHLNEESGPAFKIKNDPRITRVGKWLRKFSIDELPQMINVLKGEMSMVGPRPLFGWEIERLTEAWVKRRFSVRPGLTCIWQVSGRSNITFEKRIQMDLQYIDTWHFGLDLQLLAKTVPVVVMGRGAA
jgi:exopolysaccharide biosynthesis polyprenyl glycosylphosphotransferase